MNKVLFFSLLLGSVAFANVKPYGTFVPKRCSTSSEQVEVCFGTKVGMGLNEYVSINESSEKNIYQVTETEAMNAGINPEFFAAKLTLQNEDSEARTITIYGSHNQVSSVSLTTLAGEQVTVSSFQIVFTTL